LEGNELVLTPDAAGKTVFLVRVSDSNAANSSAGVKTAQATFTLTVFPPKIIPKTFKPFWVVSPSLTTTYKVHLGQALSLPHFFHSVDKPNDVLKIETSIKSTPKTFNSFTSYTEDPLVIFMNPQN